MSVLKSVCNKYVSHLERMSKTFEPSILIMLEEQRCDLHARLMEVLDLCGIDYQDRFDATDIAYRIARGEKC